MSARFTRGWAAALFVVGAALCFVPLLNLLAFEFAFALGLPVALCGGAAGARAARAEPSPWRAWWRGGRHATLLALVPLAPITLNALRVRNCDYLEGLAFYALLPVAGAWVASAWGVLAGAVAPRRGVWLFVAGLFATVFAGLARFWLEPPVDIFNPFLGYYPGSLYDEVIPLGGRLLTSRIEDLAFAAAALGLLDARRRRIVWRAALAMAVALTAWLGARAHGVHRDADWIRAELGGRHDTAHFRIFHPRGWSSEKVGALATELEFAHAELTEFFGRAPEVPIEAWLYGSRAQKKRLMGAGRTRIAKPWQRGLHVHSPAVGAAVLVHELAHVFSADIADAPHHLSLHHGVIPNMGMIEGLAVAATWVGGRLDPHQWSAAMQRIEVAPPLPALLRPDGFYARNSQVAYTLCGSFVRFYREQEGEAALAEAYRTGRFGGRFDALVEAWRRQLAERPLDEAVLAHARARFDRPAIFGKVCAHEIAALRREVARAVGRGDLEEAIERTDDILGHVPRDVRARLGRVGLLVALERFEAARAAADAVVADEKAGAVARARAREWLADIDARTGRPERARAAYDAVAELAFERADARRLAVKRAALGADAAGEITLGLLIRPGANIDVSLAAVRALRPEWPIGRYLYARRLFNGRKWAEARAELDAALAGGLPHPALVLEAERLRALSHFEQREYEAAAEGFGRLAGRGDLDLRAGEVDVLRQWVRRARFFAAAAEVDTHARRPEDAPRTE